MREKTKIIRNAILEAVDHHPKGLTSFIANKFKISRVAVNRHVKQLEASGLLTRTSSTHPTFSYGKDNEKYSWFSFSLPNVNKFPDYIPINIREIYEEACAALELSPRVSATLARMCLQYVIWDFFKVRKNNLYEEINAIKDKIDPELWLIIDKIRSIGNIAVHLHKNVSFIINDIDPREAKKLVLFMHILVVETYIAHYSQTKKRKVNSKSKKDICLES
ncbi:MAG: hypothetical protein K0S29_1272 [Gammaproteobacteria bacterium]|jgi:hypothetical protein|nr:hypothetical protein [Gammaproteobacteria bacterium]